MWWIILIIGVVFCAFWIRKDNKVRELKAKQEEREREKKAIEFQKRMHSSSEKTYHPYDWRERRNYVLNRDQYKCRNCGGNSGLQVHHIMPRSVKVDHSVENLITLCVYCHSDVHGTNLVPHAIQFKIKNSSIKYKKRRSRKEHRCSDCGKLIQKGTIYYFAQYGPRNHYKQKKLCERCFL